MSEKEIKTVFRVHWAWNDDKEERWLENMARQGWHLERSRGLYYRFEKGEPAEMVYRMDYQGLRGSERKEYMGLFKDVGWEHVGEFGGWQYFRTRAGDGPVPEIYTDPQSRIAKYRRLLAFLMIILVVVWTQVIISWGRPHDSHDFWYSIRVIQIAMTVLMAYAVVRLAAKIRKIRKQDSRK